MHNRDLKHIYMHMHNHSPVSGFSNGVVFMATLLWLAGLCSAVSIKVKQSVMEQLQLCSQVCELIQARQTACV